VVEENARKRIEISRIKSHVMVFSKNLTKVSYSIMVNGAALGQVVRFTYLGNMLTVDRKPGEEIKRGDWYCKCWIHEYRTCSVVEWSRVGNPKEAEVLHLVYIAVLL